MASKDPHLWDFSLPTSTSMMLNEVGVGVGSPTRVGHWTPWTWVRALLTPKPVTHTPMNNTVAYRLLYRTGPAVLPIVVRLTKKQKVQD